MGISRKLRRFVAILGLGLGIAALAPSPAPAHFRSSSCQAFGSSFMQRCAVRFTWIKGFNDPSTPDNLDRVGVLKVGSPFARNVLVLNPGTSAGSGYFRPLADDIVRDTHGRWQVWSVERRENQLEDQSVLDKYKQRQATPRQLFDYYLGFLADPGVTNHFQLIPDSSVGFARNWGMNVEIQDLHKVVEGAGRFGRRVVLGGHSLGGSITTAYATWDFNGRAGAKGLSGLVYIDGGSNPVPVTPQAATQSLQSLQTSSPWLSFGGIPAPFAGLFSATGSCGTVYDPKSPSLGYTFPPLPANLKPPLPAGVVPTNEAQYGFALDNDTSPASLIAAQGHIGHLATSGNPRGWIDDEISPIGRFAAMFCGKGIRSIDGTAWYHPLRLTIDSGAVADGNANPAQGVLDVHATHGHDLGQKMKIYAFGAALGGQGVLATASILAQQSGIPTANLTLVNRQSTYSHNDPSSAAPNNDFVANLIPFLGKIAKHRLHRR
jgi:pimeloyl-ACP methyl ester carboxylesterase